MSIRCFFGVLLCLFSQYPVFAGNVLRERVYVHTDKQIYLAGEFMWLKLYLTDETGMPASFSKVGYIELLDETTAQVQVKVEIKKGVAAGWMEIPLSLSTGYYRLVAYTRAMRNESDTVFFDKTIGVINTFRADAAIVADIDTGFVANVGAGFENKDDAPASGLADGNLSVTTDRATYATREHSDINIQGLPDNIHSLSIAVAGKAPVQSSENHIMEWNRRLNTYSTGPVRSDFLPEYEGHVITGVLLDVATQQPAEVNEGVFVLLGFVGDQVCVFGGQIDARSRVNFFTRQINGANELAIFVSSQQRKYRVNIETPFAAHAEKEMPVFYLDPEWEKWLLQRSIGLQAQYAYWIDSINRMDTTFSYFRWEPDRTYLLDEYTRFATMEEVVIEFIPSLRFRKYNNKRQLLVLLNETEAFGVANALVLLDGIPIFDHDIIFNYNPLLVRRINVYKEKFVFGKTHFDGLVTFTTYGCNYSGLVTGETTHLFDYEGVQGNRGFFAPSYAPATSATATSASSASTSSDSAVFRGKSPDYRHTLLWIPEVTCAGRQTLTIPFDTSDFTGEFQVTVEGLTKDGKALRGTSFFNVENP